MADYDRLKKQLKGDILISSFDRGRYATDASIYQIMPQAIMVPKHGRMWKQRLILPRPRAFRFCRAAGEPHNQDKL